MVVLADKQPIEVSPSSVSPALLEELISELSSLASVYHKPVETFVGPGRLGADAVAKKNAE
jgi:AP-1 complex subunit beta-1